MAHKFQGLYITKNNRFSSLVTLVHLARCKPWDPMIIGVGAVVPNFVDPSDWSLVGLMIRHAPDCLYVYVWILVQQ